MILETQRLCLREYTEADFDALFEILSDPVTMQHYPKPYDEEGTWRWLRWSFQNYREHGFGWWAVILKETGEMIGDCGVTIQNIDGEKLPEIGYHFNKKFWRQGFASEAARAVRDWAFENTAYDCLYSYMDQTNVGSYCVAQKIGMKRIKEYSDGDEQLFVYALSKEDWKKIK